jgi:erythromycin esterase-like protein
MIATRNLRASIRSATVPLTGGARDYDALIDLVGDARLVLLGEASHGTHEFYRERARITRRLVEHERFTILAAEADWPDAYRAARRPPTVPRSRWRESCAKRGRRLGSAR